MAQSKVRLAAVALGIAAAFGATAAAHAATASDKVRVIVAFKAGADSGARAAITNAGGRVKLELSELHAVAVELPRSAVAAIQKHSQVQYVEEDVMRHALDLPSGPPYQPGQTVPYGIHMVQADQLPDTFTGDRTICIIDSGVDGTHEDLAGNNMTGENLTTSGQWNSDEAHHGTHVTGTIAALDQTGVGVVGINPHKNIHIRMEKVFDASGSAPSSVITQAMLACGKNKANIITMSLGGSGASKTEQAAVKLNDKRGILQIAAAGNGGNNTVSYPAGFAEVVSVAALDENKNWATFSQFNTDVELAGPGVSVLSTVPMGTGQAAAVTVGDAAYNDAIPMTGSPNVMASGVLYNYGTGEVSDPGVAGKVCLIQRGNISFAQKVQQCQTDGGIGAIIYNNVAGPLNGTLGGAVTAIPSVGVSDTEGAAMLNQLGQTATINVMATNYALFNGTSMATPHVSGVAALVWSYFPACTAAQIRNALDMSAQDLGDPGRDVYFGYGLVQAKAAFDRLQTMGCNN